MPEWVWWFAIFALYGPAGLFGFAWLGWSGLPIVSGTTGLGAGLLLGAAIAGLTSLVSDRWPFREMEEALGELTGPLSMPTAVGLAIASGVVEELVFRGVIQAWLGFWPAVIGFTLLHLPYERTLWPWPLYAFVMGVGFGGLTVWTGDLGAAIAVHFTVNLMSLLRISARAADARP
ncbi:MAG: CPBP family intramembrane glutamic endopeptidase [Myxococcota bacterium]